MSDQQENKKNNYLLYQVKYYKLIFFFIFLTIEINLLYAQNKTAQINQTESIQLDSFIYFIKTGKDINNVGQILSSTYPAIQNHHHFLFSLISYPNNWMKFSIENPDSIPSNQILEISTSIDSVVIYEIKDSKIIRTMVNSENLPFSHREIIHRKTLFRVDFNPLEKKDFLLQIVMQGTSFRAPIKITPIAKFIEENDKETMLFSFYIGIMGIIVLFCILLRLIFSKSSIYLLYGGYVLFGLLYMLDGLGLAFQYIFPNFPQIEKHFTYVLIQGLYLFLVLFTDKFFENAKLQNWIRFFIILTSISIFTILINLIKYPIYYNFQWKFTIIILSIGCLLTLLITIKNFKKNNKNISSICKSNISKCIRP